jgi:succinate-semialdehyde dehydrogenase/glutarate-semialdehyde dehydrogenase
MTKYDDIALFIDGEWLPPAGRKTQPVVNPATGAEIGVLPHATQADLDRALAAAKRGFDVWRKVSPYERARILRRAAQLMRDRSEHIATQMTLEQGKTLAEARAEVAVSADHFDWQAEEGRRTYGRLIPGRSEGQRLLAMHEPVGPVAAFTPWNFPANMPARKISTALAAGCSCIIKPAEETPGTALALARAVADAGVPAGVLNVVFGVPAEISEYLIASPVIRKITFTGSTAVGKLLAGLAAKGVKRATMELGGHAPVIVFDDADAEHVARLSAAAKFRNAGQVCISPTRFYVHESIQDRFAERFAELARAVPVGNGLDSSSRMGPCANPRRFDAMEGFVADARKHGAEVLAGGERLGNAGYFWQPTVLKNVPNEARIMNVEPFGPIAIVNSFREFDEVVDEANRLPYGLAAYAFTASESRAIRIADAVEAGLIAINSFNVTWPETPFGGVKESGYGSEGGIEGLEGFLVTKFVSQA